MGVFCKHIDLVFLILLSKTCSEWQVNFWLYYSSSWKRTNLGVPFFSLKFYVTSLIKYIYDGEITLVKMRF